MDIVCSWPGAFDTTRAQELGFTGDATYVDIIRQYWGAYAD